MAIENLFFQHYNNFGSDFGSVRFGRGGDQIGDFVASGELFRKWSGILVNLEFHVFSIQCSTKDQVTVA